MAAGRAGQLTPTTTSGDIATIRHKPAVVALALLALLAGLPAAAHASVLAATPTALTAKALNARYVQLNWHRSTGDNGTYFYRVFRDGIAIGVRQKAISYLDRPAIGRHTYQVRAIDGAAVQSARSSGVAVTVVSRLPGSAAPAKPTNLTGVTRANGQAHLSWTGGGGGTSATHAHRVYRDGMLIATVAGTSFDDYRAGLRADGYDYTVQAVDINGYASPMTAAVHVGVTPQSFPWSGVLYFSGPSASNAVALTFDDCGNGAVVQRLADILRAHDAPGTFFCTGQATVTNVDILTKVARNFPVGNHTWDHRDLNTLSDAGVFNELITATMKIEAATGQPLPPIMRPPYGHADPGVRADVKKLGMAVVRWNIETNDWRSSTTSQDVLREALAAKAGNIVIMHDKTKTADVLAQIITGLRNKGYRLVTIPALLGIPWSPADPG